jgi:hypothetical protein
MPTDRRVVPPAVATFAVGTDSFIIAGVLRAPTTPSATSGRDNHQQHPRTGNAARPTGRPTEGIRIETHDSTGARQRGYASR